MAQMHPQYVKQNEVDQEYKIYESLRDNLDDDYHVFHSLDMLGIDRDNYFFRSEADFVIFHPKKGIIVIEAKNGSKISFRGNHWYYSSGGKMVDDGPFMQAESNKRNLLKLFDKYDESLIKNCKFLYAVWFHGMKRDDIKRIDFPPNADVDLLLSKEDLENPKPFIDKIFNIKVKVGYNEVITNLAPQNCNDIIYKILEPEFCNQKSGLELAEYIFSKLLDEQKKVLYYIEDQKTAVINGAAGTGKTFVALKKAKIDADLGNKVLFICFNSMLKDRLSKNFSHKNIDFYTMAGFAKRFDAMKNSTTGEPDYDKLYYVLENKKNNFEYTCVIVDEGQDFFISDGAIIIHLLFEIIKKNNGTFYMFYDKNQLIQYDYFESKSQKYEEFLEYIKDPDCKLTLYKNCRNTRDIAETSSRIFVENDNFQLNVLNDYNFDLTPQIYIDNDANKSVEKLREIIKEYKNFSDDIVILTCGNESIGNAQSSFILPYIKRGKFDGVEFTTCRKFKGCEADIVIVIDIRKEHLTDSKERFLYYTGTSRAKYGLALFCNLTEDDCKNVISYFDKKPYKYKIQAKYLLADKLNCNPIM